MFDFSRKKKCFAFESTQLLIVVSSCLLVFVVADHKGSAKEQKW